MQPRIEQFSSWPSVVVAKQIVVPPQIFLSSMAKDFHFKEEAGSQKSNEPRLLGSILSEMLHSDSPLAVGYRQYIASKENGEAEDRGWHTNTELGCNLKTILHSSQRMKPGKVYNGVLQCDSENIVDEFLCRDPHYTFVELPPKSPVKHNPRVFDGKHITITMRYDGTYRPNFKPMREEDVLNLARYTHEVYIELCEGLSGLIEEG